MTRDDILFYVAVFGGLAAMLSCAYQIAAYHWPRGANDMPGPSTPEKRWPRPILVNAVIALVVCGAVGFDYYDRHFGQPFATAQPLIINWGTGPGPSMTPAPNGQLFGIPSYNMTINSRPLLDVYGDKYKVLIIMRITYANVDRMTDTTIEKSSAYTITGDVFMLSHPGEGKLRFPVGGGYVEFNLVLIPKDFSADQITCLADVSKIGGLIVGSVAQAVAGGAPPGTQPASQPPH